MSSILNYYPEIVCLLSIIAWNAYFPPTLSTPTPSPPTHFPPTNFRPDTSVSTHGALPLDRKDLIDLTSPLTDKEDMIDLTSPLADREDMSDPPTVNWAHNRYESDLQQPGEEVDMGLEA